MNPAYKAPPWGDPPIPTGGALVFLSKVDNAGDAFHQGTMSLRPTDGQVQSGTDNPYYYEEAWLTKFDGVDPGYRVMPLQSSDLVRGTRLFEFATQIVDGYEVWYSTSISNHVHTAGSWLRYEPTTQFFNDTLTNPISYPYTNGTRLAATLDPDSYIDVAFKYVQKDHSAVGRIGEKLTCNFPGLAAPAVGDSRQFSTDDFKLDLGLSRAIGGIPVQMNLFALKSAAPSIPLQVTRAESAGGSSWQIAFIMKDPSTGATYVANQSAGNLMEQWGYMTDFRDNGSSWEQLYYVPFATDHVHPIQADGMTNFEISKVTSPCYNNAFRSFDAKVSFDYSQQAHNGKSAVTINNRYTLRSRANKTWADFAVDQSMYMPASVSKDASLRIYLVKGQGFGRRVSNAITVDWASFCGQFGDFARNGCGILQDGNERFVLADTIRYVVLIWNVNSVDVGVAVHRPDNDNFNTQFHLEDPNSSAFANIQFHAWIQSDKEETFNAGDERSYQMAYTFGSLDELTAHGFGIEN